MKKLPSGLGNQGSRRQRGNPEEVAFKTLKCYLEVFWKKGVVPVCICDEICKLR